MASVRGAHLRAPSSLQTICGASHHLLLRRWRQWRTDLPHSAEAHRRCGGPAASLSYGTLLPLCYAILCYVVLRCVAVCCVAVCCVGRTHVYRRRAARHARTLPRTRSAPASLVDLLTRRSLPCDMLFVRALPLFLHGLSCASEPFLIPSESLFSRSSAADGADLWRSEEQQALAPAPRGGHRQT